MENDTEAKTVDDFRDERERRMTFFVLWVMFGR
jgi:hypothetical protein